MVRLLRDVNADANPVGLYQGCFLGAFLNSSVVDGLAAIAGLMERDGASGRGKGVLIVHDLAQSAQGNTSVKAYRLSPSFVEAHKKGKFHTQSLIDHKLTFANILIEIPVSLRNTALLDAFLSSISTPSAPGPSIVQPSTSDLLRNPPTAALTPSYTSLNLALEPVLASSLESTLEVMDEHAARPATLASRPVSLHERRPRRKRTLPARRRRTQHARHRVLLLFPSRMSTASSRFPPSHRASRLRCCSARLIAQRGVLRRLLLWVSSSSTPPRLVLSNRSAQHSSHRDIHAKNPKCARRSSKPPGPHSWTSIRATSTSALSSTTVFASQPRAPLSLHFETPSAQL